MRMTNSAVILMSNGERSEWTEDNEGMVTLPTLFSSKVPTRCTCNTRNYSHFTATCFGKKWHFLRGYIPSLIYHNKLGYNYGISQLSVHSVANLSMWIKYVNFPVYCRQGVAPLAGSQNCDGLQPALGSG